MTTVKSARRTRWAIRIILALVAIASMGANILDAKQNLPSKLLNAWPPIAVVICVDCIGRVPLSKDAPWLMRWGRPVGAIALGIVGAAVSYIHMFGAMAHYGGYQTWDEVLAAWALPSTFDGLVIVLSITLVEVNRKIRDLTALDVAATIRATKTATRLDEPPPPNPVEPENLNGKQRVIQLWSRHPGLSIQQVADRAQVSYGYAWGLRKELDRRSGMELVASA